MNDKPIDVRVIPREELSARLAANQKPADVSPRKNRVASEIGEYINDQRTKYLRKKRNHKRW